jgi:hypothetical protein
VAKHNVDVRRGSEPVPARAGNEARPARDILTAAATIGVIAAGVALLEAALIPGMVIGGAAVLAPRYLPGLRRRVRPLLGPRRRIEATGSRLDRSDVGVPPAAPAGLAVKQAVAKTITIRTIEAPQHVVHYDREAL